MTGRDGRKTVLTILHQGHSTPGRIGMALDALGVRLDIRRPASASPCRDARDHAGVMVFGGPMCVNDEADWIKHEIDWLAVPLAKRSRCSGLPRRADARPPIGRSRVLL